MILTKEGLFSEGIIDEPVKSPRTVIPVKTGIYNQLVLLDSRSLHKVSQIQCGNDKGNNGKSNTARCRLAKNLTSIPFGRKLSGAYHSTLCVSNSLGAELFETKTG